jgi:hypothetical protein
MYSVSVESSHWISALQQVKTLLPHSMSHEVGQSHVSPRMGSITTALIAASVNQNRKVMNIWN